MALTKAHFRMIEGSSVNVRDFGAKGDGVTDDTAAIQAAIDSGAGELYLPAGTYKLSSTLTIDNFGQTLRGSGRDSYLVGDGTFDIILVQAASVTINSLRTGSGTSGITVGDASNKANLIEIANYFDSKSNVSIKIVHGNSGKIFGAYLEGNDLVSTDKGIYFVGGYANCNGWFTYGVRIFDKAYGYHMADTNTNQGIHHFSCEDYEVAGLQIDTDTSIRNEFHYYVESNIATYPSCKALINNSTARSNRFFQSGPATGGETGLFNGLKNGTAPIYYVTEQINYRDRPVTTTGTTTQVQPTGAHEIITITNTGGTGTLELRGLDNFNIGVSAYIVYPSTNTGKTHIDLDDPAGFSFVETGDNRYDYMEATGETRIFTLTRISSNQFSISEVSGLTGQSVALDIDATTNVTMSMINYKSNSIFKMLNTSTITKTATLTNISFRRLGDSYMFWNVSGDTINLTLGAGAYIDGTTNKAMTTGSGYELTIIDPVNQIVSAKALS